MKTYSFCYSLSDRITMVSTHIRVQARNYRQAARKAEAKLKQVVKQERAAFWEWQGPWEGPYEAVYIPYHYVKGILYRGHEEKSTLAPRSPSVEDSNRVVESMSWVNPILGTVDEALVLSSLFEQSLYQPTEPVIPMVMCHRMPREEWPDRHP